MATTKKKPVIIQDQRILQVTFVEAFKAFREATEQLAGAIRKEDAFPIWANEFPRQRDYARAEVIKCVGDYQYTPDQDPHKSHGCVALVGVSLTTLDLVRALNVAREVLHNAMKDMDGQVTTRVNRATGQERELTLLQAALEDLRVKHFHRRQATRKFVVLDEAPARATFIRASLPKISRWTHKRVSDELKKRRERTDHDKRGPIDRDIALMLTLSTDDVFAYRDPPHLHQRVNLVFRRGDDVVRLQKRAVIPVFYPAAKGAPLPEIRPLPTGDLPPRLSRSDRTIEEAPLLQTLTVHRYIKQPPRD